MEAEEGEGEGEGGDHRDARTVGRIAMDKEEGVTEGDTTRMGVIMVETRGITIGTRGDTGVEEEEGEGEGVIKTEEGGVATKMVGGEGEGEGGTRTGVTNRTASRVEVVEDWVEVCVVRVCVCVHGD